jgi:uncharacterized protein involved in exopolysaccharide biosynthesis
MPANSTLTGQAPSSEPSLPSANRASEFSVQAISAHKLMVLLIGVVLALAGVAVGLARKPTYTSSSTLQVGTVNLNSPGFFGFVQSASALATLFSRTVAAEPVLRQIDAKLGIDPATATRRLSAEPVPLSPSFRIIATGPTAASAVSLANAASAAVIAYNVHSASTTRAPIAPLLAEYDHAAGALQSAAATVARLARGHARSGESPQLIRARSQLDSAKVRATALGASYQSALVSAGANPSSGIVSLLAGAVTASDDRASKIQLLAFTGLLAGLVLGAAGAVAYEHRRAARRSG